MNIYLAFIVIVLCVVVDCGSPFRRTHGKRYHRQEVRQPDDSGDEFHQKPASGKAAVAEEKSGRENDGYNSHFNAEPTPTATVEPVKIFESTFSSVNRETNREHVRQNLADQVGYGFKFSSVIPHDVRYTIPREVPLLQPTNEPADVYQQLVQEQANQQVVQEPVQAYQQVVQEPVQAYQQVVQEAVQAHQQVVQEAVPPVLIEEEFLPIQRLEGYTPGAEINFDLPPPSEQIAEHHALLHTLPDDVIPHTISDHDHNIGFSEGSGLRAIAQGSADRAQAAVIGQHIAAQQAAFVAKSAVAQSAIQSAAVAIAALAGKEVLVYSLQKQTEDARLALDHEINQLELIKKTTATARHASQKAAYHVSVLTAALNNAQQAAQQAEENSKSASEELTSQTKMVTDAKEHLDGIIVDLRNVHIDYEATKDAAGQASAAADQAQHNAHVIGEKASLLLQQHGLTVHPHYHH